MALTRNQQIDRINALLTSQEREVGRHWLTALTRFNSVSLASIERALESGGTVAVLDLFSDGVEEYAQAVAQETFINAGQAQAAIMSQVTGIQTRFDIVSPDIINAMQSNQVRLVQQVTDEQRKVINRNLVDGAQSGVNPRETARSIRQNIGLTANQEKFVSNYRNALETGSRNALDRQLRDRRFDGVAQRAIDGDAIPQEQINRMVDAYRRRYIKYRSEVIARTESLRSVNEAQEAVTDQLIGSSRMEFERTWWTARDERVRGSHASMHGQKRDPGESFVSGLGNSLRWPGDRQAPASETIQCRCVLITRVKR